MFITVLHKWGYIRLPFVEISAFEAIPNTSPIIVEMDHYYDLERKIEGADYKDDLAKLYPIKKLKEDFESLDYLFGSNTELNLLNESRLTAALQSSGSKDVNYLYVLSPYETDIELAKYIETIDGARSEKSVYLNQDVFQLDLENGKTVSISKFRNLILVARFSFLVEDAIKQLKNRTTCLCMDAYFKKAIKEKGEPSNLKVLTNFQTLPDLLSIYAKSDSKETLQILKRFGQWSRLDLDFKKDVVESTGAFWAFQKNALLSQLKQQKVNEFERSKMAEVMPDNIALMTWMGFDDFDEFYEDIASETESAFERYFLPWIDNELTFAITEPFSSNIDADNFLVLRSIDTDLSKHYLEKFAERSGELESWEYMTYTIKRILSDDLLKPIVGNELNTIKNPFYTVIGDYVVFCNSRQALEIWIDKYVAGQTLSKDVSFLRFNLKAPKAGNLFFYVNTTSILQLLRSFTKEELTTQLDREFQIFKKIGQIGVAFEPTARSFNTLGHFQFSSKTYSRTSIGWKAHLADNVAIAPVVLKNENTNQFEIAVQDESNNFYLLDRGGNVLLEKKLDGRILSTIYQLDYYKNGNEQLLFNTADKIYLMDKKGKSISNFPINLQSPATNGLTLVDFDNEKDYAYFLACENSNVYGFQKSGRPLSGWNPKAGMGKVHFPLLHFQKDDNDYLSVLNRWGDLHVMKRNGSKRFTKRFDNKFNSPPSFELNGKSSRIVVTDLNGKAYVVNLDGGLFKLNLDVGAKEDVHFVFADIGGDKRKDYAVLSQKDLSAYYYKEKTFTKLYDYQFEQPQDALFYVELSGQTKEMVGTLDRAKKQIYLFNDRGELYYDFPMAGTTTFDVVNLFNDGENVLLVGFENSVYAYKLR